MHGEYVVEKRDCWGKKTEQATEARKALPDLELGARPSEGIFDVIRLDEEELLQIEKGSKGL